MAKKKVIAYFMHESEESAANQMMTNVQRTDSYLLGEIEESDIVALENQGVILEDLEPKLPEEATEGEGVSLTTPDAFGGLGLSVEEDELAVPSFGLDLTKPNYYLIQINGPVLEEWRQELEADQVNLVEQVQPNVFTAKLELDQVDRLRNRPYVGRVQLFESEPIKPKTDTSAAGPPVGAPSRAMNMLTFDIRLHNEEDRQTVKDWLDSKRIIIAGDSGRKIRIFLLENSPELLEIQSQPEVQDINEYVPPHLHHDHARVLLGLEKNDGAGNVTPVISQTGMGQIVGVADTGIDEDHPDFQNRIVGVIALGRYPADATDPHGHGTHVSGSVLGDGTASQGLLKGAAPDAQLYFQSLLDAQGGLGGLPFDLNDLFEDAYLNGARIHNNSWGASTEARYVINSMEVDEFIARRRDMLIIISAGNDGQAAIRRNSQKGFVDWLSVGSPATSKNALTVGASRSSRTNGGYSQLSYGVAWPNDFPDPPISNEKISGKPLGIAGFSSRGPSNDRRIKPDLVAPGTDIASAKSKKAAFSHFWGSYPNNNHYAFMGGTSMAAPLVAGCAALLRQYFVDDRSHDPSASLLKSALINGTRWLTETDAVADHAVNPNYHQGFGCVYMLWSIPNASEPNLNLSFLDNWQDPSTQFNIVGQRFRYRFNVSGGERLRLCLAWTDPPGRALQNNLNLMLQHQQSGQKWIGNADLPLSLTRFDTENNVEVIRIDNPPPGDYLVVVFAKNLLQKPQDWSLVVSGDSLSDLLLI